jgi:hypothetical protein
VGVQYDSQGALGGCCSGGKGEVIAVWAGAVGQALLSGQMGGKGSEEDSAMVGGGSGRSIAEVKQIFKGT